MTQIICHCQLRNVLILADRWFIWHFGIKKTVIFQLTAIYLLQISSNCLTLFCEPILKIHLFVNKSVVMCVGNVQICYFKTHLFFFFSFLFCNKLDISLWYTSISMKWQKKLYCTFVFLHKSHLRILSLYKRRNITILIKCIY